MAGAPAGSYKHLLQHQVLDQQDPVGLEGVLAGDGTPPTPAPPTPAGEGGGRTNSRYWGWYATSTSSNTSTSGSGTCASSSWRGRQPSTSACRWCRRDWGLGLHLLLQELEVVLLLVRVVKVAGEEVEHLPAPPWGLLIPHLLQQYCLLVG